MTWPPNSRGQPCLGLRAAARRLGISPAGVRWAIEAGYLHAEAGEAGGQALTLIPVDDVDAYKQRRARRFKAARRAERRTS